MQENQSKNSSNESPQSAETESAELNAITKEEEQVTLEQAEEDALLKAAAKKEAEQTKLIEELVQWKDKYVRLVADFENFKKRSRQEVEQKLKFSAQPFIENVVLCLDDLELALKHFQKEIKEENSAGLSGLQMTVQKFHIMLSGHGVERILTEKQSFDPNLHEAVAINESDELEENTIFEEYQTGYTLHGRVLRPAKVQVVKKIKGNEVKT